ncbi:MAG: carboxypeptidase regulatory-like domain-containing protein, partial [Victivallales bacterium]|nr:carboxypeptidase regulatory-like domain-containing protein [Victivallales bacterium]
DAIALKPGTAGSASSAMLTGIASYSDDGAQWQRAANATVTVGALSVRTNANGEYVLTNVPPGAATVRAAYANYPTIVASFTAQAGQQIRFNPQFVRNTASSTLTVSVSSLQSAAPLEGASVALNGIQRQTDAEGKVYFNEGVSGGENVVNVSAPGHEARIITFSIEGQQHVKLPVALAVAASLQPGRVVLEGTVTDAATALPLSGASVRVLGTTHEAVTDERGRYRLDAGSAGSHKVVIEKAGYQSHEQTLKLASGVLHQFDVPLAAVPSAGQPTKILLLVSDEATHQPISGATVSLSGSNPYEVQTDAAGEASFTGLNSGTTQFQVTAPGYDTAAFFIDVQAGQNYRVPVELRASVAAGDQKIYGTVLDAQSRRPIAGARVVLTGIESRSTITDTQGRYEIDGITPGAFGLSVAALGYKGSSRNLSIQSSTNLDIALVPDMSGQLSEKNLRAVVAGHANYTDAAAGYLFIFGIPGTSGTVVNSDKGINQDFTIDASGVAEIMIPSNQFLKQPNTVSEKALFIYASNPVSAYFLNREAYTTDMSYLLDASSLGTEYRILGWKHALGMLQFSLTALEDDTVATVTPASPLSTGQVAGESFDVVLQKGQSVLYTSTNGNDLTGSLIVANKSLAVFSGAQCSNVPQNVTACDHLFTQLPPVQHWASEYIVAETANTGTAGNLVRILAHTDDTQIKVNGTEAAILGAGQFHEITSAGDLHIETSHPVLVAQFLKGYSWTGHGDPAFSFIAGIHQALKDYAFTAPVNLASYEQNYLNLVVPDSALSSLELNGAGVDTGNFRAVPDTGYSTGRVKIEPGSGRITANQKFLATISGFTGYDSYHTIIGAAYSVGASALPPAVISLTVATDQPSYPGQTPVRLQALAGNRGDGKSPNLQLVLRINDAQGFEVARFEHSDFGSLQAGGSTQHEEPWNTANYPAGSYVLIGELRDANANVVEVDSTLFAITSGNAADAPHGALSVAADKAEYQSNDLVQLNSLARNLTLNAAIDAARVHLHVFDPNGEAVFEHEHAIGQMSPGALRELGVPQALRDAPLGAYTVQATLYGRLPGQQKRWQ